MLKTKGIADFCDRADTTLNVIPVTSLNNAANNNIL
jgi:hypothetical protein